MDFKKACELSKKMTLEKLNKFKADNKKICGYAATAKSTTVLNYCNIGNDIIDFICDTTSEKNWKVFPRYVHTYCSYESFKKKIFQM